MKDAKGHGSEKRGGVDQSKPLKDAGIIRAKGIRAMYGPGSPGYPTHPLSINGTNAAMDRARTSALALINGGQPVASDAQAAATLASGSKSAPVDTHPAMTPTHGYIHNDPGNTRYRNGQKMPTDL